MNVKLTPVVVVVHVLFHVDGETTQSVHDFFRAADFENDVMVNRYAQKVTDSFTGLLDSTVGIGAVDLVVADVGSDKDLSVSGNTDQIQKVRLSGERHHQDRVGTRPFGVEDPLIVVVVVDTDNEDVEPFGTPKDPLAGFLFLEDIQRRKVGATRLGHGANDVFRVENATDQSGQPESPTEYVPEYEALHARSSLIPSGFERLGFGVGLVWLAHSIMLEYESRIPSAEGHKTAVCVGQVILHAGLSVNATKKGFPRLGGSRGRVESLPTNRPADLEGAPKDV